MKMIITLFVSLLSTEINAQHIFKYNEWYSIITLKKNDQVYVTEEIYNNTDTFVSKYGFKRTKTGLFYRHQEDEFSNEDTSEKYEPCQLYPSSIKIRNNNFAITEYRKRTVLYDKKGRLLTAYFPTTVPFHEIQPSHRFLYVNDTVVYQLISDGQANPKQLYKFELDVRKYLKSVFEAVVDDKVRLRNSSEVAQITFSGATKFLYNKHNRLDSIQTFTIDNGKMIKTSTQVFAYQNDRPIKSYVLDATTHKIVYEQLYQYKIDSDTSLR